MSMGYVMKKLMTKKAKDHFHKTWGLLGSIRTTLLLIQLHTDYRAYKTWNFDKEGFFFGVRAWGIDVTTDLNSGVDSDLIQPYNYISSWILL